MHIGWPVIVRQISTSWHRCTMLHRYYAFVQLLHVGFAKLKAIRHACCGIDLIVSHLAAFLCLPVTAFAFIERSIASIPVKELRDGSTTSLYFYIRNGGGHFSCQEMIVYASTRIPLQQGERERIWGGFSQFTWGLWGRH